MCAVKDTKLYKEFGTGLYVCDSVSLLTWLQ